jgi:DNA-binding transcriptional regulator YdaS (Cro superfamily)
MTLNEWIRQHAHGQRAAACRRLGWKLKLSEKTIRAFANGNRQIRAEYVLQLEAATAGVVSRHEMRPDIYPKGKIGKVA